MSASWDSRYFYNAIYVIKIKIQVRSVIIVSISFVAVGESGKLDLIEHARARSDVRPLLKSQIGPGLNKKRECANYFEIK